MGIALKHLSEAERIRTAESLFKVTSRDMEKGELHGLCPVHGEKNPSFSYNFKKDTYYCFSCNAEGDLLKLWSEVHGYGQKEGFQAFCRQFGIQAHVGPEHRSGAPDSARGDADGSGPELDAVWEKFPPLPEEQIKDLEDSRGWSRRWIDILDLRLQTHYLDKKTGNVVKIRKAPERIAIPVRDVAGTMRNIRLYKPGGGQYKIISWGKSYGSARLFPARPLNETEPVLLCEGESDTICALSHGFNAITQTSKMKNWRKNHLEPFRGRDVVIAYDADQAGRKYASFAAENLAPVARSVRIIEWPDYMRDESGEYPKNHGQDLTDFFVRYGKKPSDLQELITAARVYDPDEKDAVTGPMQFFERGVNDRLSFKPRLLAERIMKEYHLLSDPKTGLMYRWNGKFWDEFDDDHIKNTCIRYLANEAQKSRVEDAAYQVKMLSTIPHGREVNDRTEWICLQNGMLNLDTLDLEPHRHEFYATYTLPVSFDPDDPPECEVWLRYLQETVRTAEAIAQLQEFLGYCLLRSTKYEKCLLLIGPGADGKSTFLKIIKEMVGDENCASVSFPDLEDQFQRSSLYGKLVNLSTEVGAKAIESPYFKAITSGDPINAAFKHRNAFTFSPYCKLAFAANRLPRVLDNSDGFFRRVLPVRFKRQFIDDADPDLFDKLKEELSGIFSWAIFGLHRLLDQNRFTDSEETRKLMMEYRRANNPVLCFVEDRCTLGEEYETEKVYMYTEYKKYCSANGFTAMNRENFFRELYIAVNNLKQYRPRHGEARKYMLKGIGLEVSHDS